MASSGIGISVLGGFRLSVAGEALPGLSLGSQRLLAFLALRTGLMTRTSVAGTLWPDSSEDHAFANLRSALSRLPPPARDGVNASFQELTLGAGVSVDLQEAKALAAALLDEETPIARHSLLKYAAVFEGDLLPGWYEDWVVVETEGWRQLRLHALEALSARLTAAQQFGAAATAALASIRAEPLRESAHAALIRAHLAEGNQSEALSAFGRYRSLLESELGLQPTPRLTLLVQTLRRA